MPRVFNKPEHKNIRKILRKQEVGAEKKLWYKLRADQLGYRFRRQYGIGNYIVDFYCPSLKLVVEIDGATHSTEEESKNDIKRQKYLENLGLKVKRYSNNDVYEYLDEVANNIYQCCLYLKSKRQEEERMK